MYSIKAYSALLNAAPFQKAIDNGRRVGGDLGQSLWEFRQIVKFLEYILQYVVSLATENFSLTAYFCRDAFVCFSHAKMALKLRHMWIN